MIFFHWRSINCFFIRGLLLLAERFRVIYYLFLLQSDKMFTFAYGYKVLAKPKVTTKD